MRVIDTSALVAIVFAEPERTLFLSLIHQEHPVLLSTPSALETRLVVYSRRGSQGIALLETMLQLPLFRLVAPDAVDIETAYTAFTQYGKGSGHPAGLNFGDLFSYALAKTRRLPLLSKGDDFSQTDIVSAWRPT